MLAEPSLKVRSCSGIWNNHGGRAELLSRLPELARYSQASVTEQLETVDDLERQLADCEAELVQMLSSLYETQRPISASAKPA